MAVSAAEVTAIQSDFDNAMADTCQIGADTGTQSSYSPDPDDPNWVYGGTLACGVNTHRPEEALELGQATLTDATIRVPVGTTVTGEDRVRVTKRHGSTLGTAEVYAVKGDPRRGISGLILNCLRVVGESVQ